MKKILIFVGVVFLFFVAIEYIKYRQEFIDSLDIFFQLIEEEEVSPTQQVKVYLLNSENRIEEITVDVSYDETDLVGYIFDLYTSKSNSLPLGYYTPINVSASIINVSYDSEVITLILSDDIYRTMNNQMFYSLTWSYYFLGFKEINIITTSGKAQSLNFNDYKKINLVIETSLPKASQTTVFYPTPNGSIPTTYMHNNLDIESYIFKKLISYYKMDINKITIDKINYQDTLYCSITDESNLINEEFIVALKRSYIFNGLYDDVIIIKNNQVFS